jgi:hypothetical protein
MGLTEELAAIVPQAIEATVLGAFGRVPDQPKRRLPRDGLKSTMEVP